MPQVRLARTSIQCEGACFLFKNFLDSLRGKPGVQRTRWVSTAVFGSILALVALLALLDRSDADQRSTTGTPHDFSYYVLALSWSPTYCAERGRKRGDPQCSTARPYAFVLHGLWPQHEQSWPEFCRSGGSAFVPESVLKAMLDIMPARRLVIHQYRKHGTCSGLTAKAYFDAARRLFDSIQIPKRFASPRDFQTLSPDQIEAAFVAANDHLSRDSIAVACGGRRLREVRLCFSKDLKPQSCGENEDQKRLCRRDRVVLPPVRQGGS